MTERIPSPLRPNPSSIFNDKSQFLSCHEKSTTTTKSITISIETETYASPKHLHHEILKHRKKTKDQRHATCMTVIYIFWAEIHFRVVFSRSNFTNTWKTQIQKEERKGRERERERVPWAERKEWRQGGEWGRRFQRNRTWCWRGTESGGNGTVLRNNCYYFGHGGDKSGFWREWGRLKGSLGVGGNSFPLDSRFKIPHSQRQDFEP